MSMQKRCEVGQARRECHRGQPSRPRVANELMRLVADGLAASGLDIRPSEGTADQVGQVVIGRDDADCELSVGEQGRVQLGYRPRSGEAADPKLPADLATVLLTGQRGDLPRLGNGYDHPGVTLKGMVGLELRERGLDVRLAVYGDDLYFESCSEIVATNPGDADGDDGQVYVTDDGGLLWVRDFSAEHETVRRHPQFTSRITDPEGLAGEVVAALGMALGR
jgi:hypothetical protein